LSLITKQTAVFAVALIFILLLRKYGVGKTIRGIAFPLSCIFLILLPFFFSGYSPFFVANISVGDKVFNIASENALGVPEWQKIVSGGAHNIWPIITSVFNNQTGWSRFTYTDSALNQVLGISYVRFSLYLTLGLFFFIVGLTLLSLKTRVETETAKVAFMAYLAVFAAYIFSTRMHERYLFLALPLLFFAFPWIKNRKLFAFLCGSLALTFLFSIYGSFSLAAQWVPQSLPNFLPNANPLNLFAYSFVSNDFSITVLCLANVLIFAMSLTLACVKIICEFRHGHMET